MDLKIKRLTDTTSAAREPDTMTFAANTPERDDAIRTLSAQLTNTAAGHPMDITAAAAALVVALLSDQAKDPDFDRYCADKLRKVANVLDPQN